MRTLFCLLVLCAIAASSSADNHPTQETKAVLITGASSGIGRVTAEQLAAKGYFVYAGARKDADMKALNAIDNIKAVRLDVTKQEEISAAVKLIEAEGRGLWGIVNNAGVNVIDPLIEANESDLDFIFDVNVYGVFRVTKAFAPMVIAAKGRIVNISSISGVLSGGLMGYGMYSMSKHAIEAFTDSLAFEMAGLGVHVSGVEPGGYSTQIGMSRCKRMLGNNADTQYKYFGKEMAFYYDLCRKRMEEGLQPNAPPPVEVAEVIEHALFSDKPKEHYLITPIAFESRITIGKAFEELVNLNHDHKFSMSREELIKILDDELAIARGEKERSWEIPE